jgi:hypothetical protein
MERELWSLLSAAVTDIARTRRSSARFTHDTQVVVRVYLWSVLHDRPVSWACQVGNWPSTVRPRALPSQPTMSRRLRSQAVWEFLDALGRRLRGRITPTLLKVIDGKPLPVSRHSQDPDATWGRGAGGLDKGYKLHALWGEDCMPLAWAVHPLNVSEPAVATKLLPALEGGGYVLGDANYHAGFLCDLAAEHEHQLVAPRQRPGTSLGHRRQSKHRLRCIALLEGPGMFGPELFQGRRSIETRFAGLTGFGGGLVNLPPWVRRWHRVRLYVHAKLLINAARLRRLDKHRKTAQ